MITKELTAFLEKNALVRNPERAGITIGATLYEAFLELAKADALVSLDRSVPFHDCICASCCNLHEKRTKLYEALQR